jgi:hypothetical protein
VQTDIMLCGSPYKSVNHRLGTIGYKYVALLVMHVPLNYEVTSLIRSKVRPKKDVGTWHKILHSSSTSDVAIRCLSLSNVFRLACENYHAII